MVGCLALMWASMAPAEDLLNASGDAKDALSALDIGKFTRARELVTKSLEKDPDHFIANWVMVQVYYEYEANFPRALFLLRKIRKILEGEYGDKPDAAEAQTWHKKMLKREASILGQMDRREDQLAVYVHYDELYKPSIEVNRIWPLMKLGRFDDARKIGKKLIYSDHFNTRLRAYNGLMAIADEARERKESYKWGKEGLERTQKRSCIIASNLARSALQNVLFDEAEEYVKIARKATHDDCSSNPLSQLVSIHLLQGEFQKTISTLHQLRKEPLSQRMRVQFEMANKARMVELLYALGQFKESEKRIREVLQAPDRVGMTSASKENQALTNMVLFWSVLDARREQERERAGIRGFVEATRIRLKATKLKLVQWEKSRMALRLGTLQNLLVTALRPYYLDLMPWYAPALIRILGSGVVIKAIGDARQADADMEKKLSGYFDAVEAEAHWRAGRTDEARKLADRSLGGLPKKAKLVRWRAQAILAQIAWRGGSVEDARKHFHEVLHKYPTVLRQLAVRLPVTVQHSGGSDAEAIAEKLHDSRRLSTGKNSGFEVRVEQNDDGIRLCLRGARDFQYACVGTQQLESEQKQSDDKLEGEERLLALIDLFHDKAFAPLVELTQSDINTLDGRTGRIGADRAVKDILGESGK